MDRALNLSLRVSGTAISGIDYRLSPTWVHFAPGSNLATIHLAPIDDGLGDPGETVVLSLTDLPAGCVSLVAPTTTITLNEVDDRMPPTVSIEEVAQRALSGGAATVSRQVVSARIYAWDDQRVRSVSATLDGTAVAVNESMLNLHLQPGPNILVVTAVDGAGNQAQATATITYRPLRCFALQQRFARIGTGEPVPATPALLGLASGDLRRFDPIDRRLVDVLPTDPLHVGEVYLLKEGIDAPVVPPAGCTAEPVPAGRADDLVLGWNLRAVTGGLSAEWTVEGVSVIVDGGPPVSLGAAIADGRLAPYCWAMDPDSGAVCLITRDPGKVPGSGSLIPAGWPVWFRSWYDGSIQLVFAPAGKG